MSEPRKLTAEELANAERYIRDAYVEADVQKRLFAASSVEMLLGHCEALEAELAEAKAFPTGLLNQVNAMRLERDQARAEAKRLREALEYYAFKAFNQEHDHAGRRKPIDVTADWGFKAREALKGGG